MTSFEILNKIYLGLRLANCEKQIASKTQHHNLNYKSHKNDILRNMAPQLLDIVIFPMVSLNDQTLYVITMVSKYLVTVYVVLKYFLYSLNQTLWTLGHCFWIPTHMGLGPIAITTQHSLVYHWALIVELSPTQFEPRI